MNNIISDLFEPLIRMSATGSVLILLLLFLRNKLNAKWNYHVNIIVVLFMILPLNTGFLLRDIPLPSLDLVNLVEKSENKLVSEHTAKEPANAEYINLSVEENIQASSYEPYEAVRETETLTGEVTEKTKSKSPVNYKYIIGFIYLSGLLLFSSRKFAGYIKFRKFLESSSVSLKDERILSLYEKCAAELSIKRKVKFYANDSINSPMMFGLFKPAVYLPDLTFGDEEMYLILKHELIHFKRNDLWYKFAVSVVRAVHWFNPLCILFEKNADVLCELSCDELVIANMDRQERKFYCKTIINTMGQSIEKKTKPKGVYVAINSSRTQMERRFTHMLNYKKNGVIKTIISCLLVGVIITVAVFASACNSPRNTTLANYLVTMPEEMGNIASIYSNSAVTGAIDTEGRVYIWGNNTFGQCDVPFDLPPITDLGIGAHCVIALDVDGKLHGWGTNEYNAMDFIDHTGTTFIDVDANAYHTAALTSDGKVYKWGEANNGGQGYVPNNLPSIVSVKCGTYVTTAIDVDSKVHLWGMRSAPDDFPNTVKAEMTAVLESSVIVLDEDGKLYGEIPHNNFNNKYKEQPEIENIKAIYGNSLNAAAIDENGKIYIWGEYEYVPGESSIIDISENLPPIVQVAFGFNCVTALGENGKIYEWGLAGYEVIRNVDLNDLNCSVHEFPARARSGSADVYTMNELLEAVQNRVKDIYVKADINIKGAHEYFSNETLYIENGQTLHIDENVTLSVHLLNLGIYKGGDLINNGTINVYGRILFDKETTKAGKIISLTSEFSLAGDISMQSDKLTLSEVKRILDGDLPYNYVSSICWEDYTFVIDEDYTLEEGKSIWLNAYTTLKVAEGVTLTIEGKFTAVNDPIIEGTVIGNFN